MAVPLCPYCHLSKDECLSISSNQSYLPCKPPKKMSPSAFAPFVLDLIQTSVDGEETHACAPPSTRIDWEVMIMGDGHPRQSVADKTYRWRQRSVFCMFYEPAPGHSAFIRDYRSAHKPNSFRALSIAEVVTVNADHPWSFPQ